MANEPIKEVEQSAPAKDFDDAASLLRPLLRDPEQAEGVVRRVFAFASFRGPMPPPVVMSGYEAIVPGSAKAILEMAQKEQKHRHKVESRETAYPFAGLILGGLAFFGCVAGAICLAFYDKAQGLQFALVATPMLGVIGWFVNSRIDKHAATPDQT